MKMNLSMMI